MKGVILSGGFGTRMNPATKTTNKHLLPLYVNNEARPMIDFPIETLKGMGITEILIISSKEHCGILIDYLGDGYDRGLDFTFKIQEMRDPSRPAGIASALKLCKGYTKDEEFCVILGDNYFENSESIMDSKLKEKYDCKIFCKKTNNWNRFGIIDIKNGVVNRIVEKPKEYISDMAVTGLYVFNESVYKILPTLIPSGRGELEVTDILNYYGQYGKLDYEILDTFWGDMGTPESLIDTQNFINGRNA